MATIEPPSPDSDVIAVPPPVTNDPPITSDTPMIIDPPGPEASGSSAETTVARSSPEKQASPRRSKSPTRPQGRNFWVELRRLPSSEKSLYGNFAQQTLASDDEFDANEWESIVGEYQEGNNLFYYARYSNGISYKFRADTFSQKHPDLLRKYEQSKADGSLLPFDPSATSVHPASRVKMPLNISTARRRQRKLPVFESSADELAGGPSSDDDYSVVSAKQQRRSTRTAALDANKKLAPQRQTKLPFSPKKTRSTQITIHNSDSESGETKGSEAEKSARPLPSHRRSGRSRKTLRDNLADEEYHDIADDDDDDDMDDDEYAAGPSKPTSAKKKKPTRKPSRPAYGHFRSVEELQLDEEDNSEDAALKAHRSVCEKCLKQPAHILLAAYKKKNKRGRARKAEDDEEGSEEQRIEALGGWVRCLKCPISAHWNCLAKTQRDEILRAARERDNAAFPSKEPDAEGLTNGDDIDPLQPVKRTTLEVQQTTEFVCGSCMKGGICMGCGEVALNPDDRTKASLDESAPELPSAPSGQDVEMSVESNVAPIKDASSSLPEPPDELLFRCITCKRLAHYAHLPVPRDLDPPSENPTAAELAEHYQTHQRWQCADCFSYVYSVEHILAWRPYPKDAVEPSSHPANYKSALPREYLVKWADRSYRRTQWVPHMWLLTTHSAKLKNFLTGGSKIELLAEPEPEVPQDGPSDTPFEVGQEIPRDSSVTPELKSVSPFVADPDAERKIPPAWKTVDRVLDVIFWHPGRKSTKATKQTSRKGRKKSSKTVESDSDSETDAFEEERLAAYEHGEMPRSDLTETVDEYESRTNTDVDEDQIGRVIWAFFKWNDLGYEDATWDSPPQKGEPGYAAFERAFKRFIQAREVEVPLRGKQELKLFQDRPKGGWNTKFTTEHQPQLGQNAHLKLMDFQIDGVNWLCRNWWDHQNCILADEMGLGKTIQIVTFIGCVSRHKAFPALVVVPNSTLTNWVREFERWAPELRVVPFYGESKAREVIKRFELHHSSYDKKNTTGAKFHVLVTTFETVTNKTEFNPVFKSIPRWELLVVDEGQRLKSDASLIFKKLKELNTAHRIIMTGTPLNNNIRELFNLMNFLDPAEWHDLEALSKEYEELSEESIKELHSRLRPYFLRRMKAEVLKLPPKNEVIVPVSMAPLQKEIYRSLLSQNLSILQSLAQGLSESAKTATAGKGNMKTNMNNVLMQLRKCLQHPYLVSETIEPRGLPPAETHERLIDASAKLRLLKMLLPRLKARGHRVLLFSQFAIALDVIEDFLRGENINYLRLDGGTKQSDRQKGMDEFNKPDSDVFIYILTTRAGGVGINLWSADTVIIFDPDFNPHQDLQAIARAHRYGQQKTCLVFKLMVKDSAEEKIMQTGKKKMVLDHLIVQKMDDENGSKEDVQSILMYGAMALFEDGAEQATKDIQYSEHDIDSLIDKTEQEGDGKEPENGSNASMSFAFAKVWSTDKETLEEMADDEGSNANQVDAWAQALARLEAERTKEKAKEVTGRGVRRKAAAVFPKQNYDLGESPKQDLAKNKARKGKGKVRSKSKASDESDAYAMSDAASATDHTDDTTPMDVDDVLNMNPVTAALPAAFDSLAVTSLPLSKPAKLPRIHLDPDRPKKKTRKAILPQATDPPVLAVCGLCNKHHAENECTMTQDSENLAEYRYMLLVHSEHEPVEERRAAIRVIDETLYKRGMLHLIYGQPLELVTTSVSAPPPRISSGALSRRPVPPTRTEDTTKQTIPQSRIPIDSTIIGTSKQTSSKRSLSPLPGGSSPLKKKKLKEAGTSTCPVCGRSPQHLIKDCPVVAEGPKQMKEAIKRLDGNPVHYSTSAALRNILIKQQRRALSSDVIDLSD